MLLTFFIQLIKLQKNAAIFLVFTEVYSSIIGDVASRNNAILDVRFEI